LASNKRLTLWSIAGSDSSGGAGVQADNQCFRSFGLAFANIVTAVTAQNTQGVLHIDWMSGDSIARQWQSIETDHPPAAIKIGLLGQDDHFRQLRQWLPKSKCPVVLDPVIKASNGDTLALSTHFLSILPYVSVFTPNKPEFETLFYKEIQQLGFENAAHWVSQHYDLCLVITGGDDEGSAQDHVYLEQQFEQQCLTLESPKLASKHTHGTGCSFSSAIASLLALDYPVIDAIVLAKAYLNQGLAKPDCAHAYPAAFQHTGFPSKVDYLPAITTSTLPETLNRPFAPAQNSLGLYVLVENLDELKLCLNAQVDTLQLRLKTGTLKEKHQLISHAIELANAANTPLYINDHWELAIEYKAYGVHLGQDDLLTADLHAIQKAGLKLGISTHNAIEMAIAHQYKPSYIAFGPVFATKSKQVDYPTLNPDHLFQFVKLLKEDYQLTAIGGINTQNAKDVLALDLHSLAVISAVTKSRDPVKAIDELSTMIKRVARD
jgi:hydroxymethylpyrimidine kinase/phosphomethylpyrimidine kinase/thiamine-phosphate diphosphorylase